LIFVYLYRRVVATTKNIISKSLYDKDYDPLIRAFLIMGKVINRVGETHVLNNGDLVQIIEYYGCENCSIKFKNNQVLKNVQYVTLKNKTIKSPTQERQLMTRIANKFITFINLYRRKKNIAEINNVDKNPIA